MGRIKFKALMKRGSKDAVFPKTAAKQVIFADGKNLEEKMGEGGGSGSGAPMVKMVVPSVSRTYLGIGQIILNTYVPSRSVEFSVEGHDVSSFSITNIDDPSDYIEAEKDPDTGVFVANFTSKGKYIVEPDFGVSDTSVRPVGLLIVMEPESM